MRIIVILALSKLVLSININGERSHAVRSEYSAKGVGDPSAIFPTVERPKIEKSHPIYDFANNLYSAVSELSQGPLPVPTTNILISPFSIRTTAALLYLGANGTTALEFSRVFQFPQDSDKLVTALAKHLQQSEAQQGQNFDFKVGNGIFVQKGLALDRNYKTTVESRLRTRVVTLDFAKSSEAANEINSWVARVTGNRIPTLVDATELRAKPTLFMANALYFSALWDRPFSNTSKSVFHLESDRRLVRVPMMQIEHRFGYSYLPELNATGIAVPFKDSRFEMILIKPETGLKETESLLQGFSLYKLVSEINSTPRSVLLRMPKFKLDSTYHLKDVMQKLGLELAFSQGGGDLSGILESGSKQAVSDLIHKASVEVNEKGAVVAAATGAQIYPISSPSVFTLDKPFLFLINDRLTGPVLIGRIVNPLL